MTEILLYVCFLAVFVASLLLPFVLCSIVVLSGGGGGGGGGLIFLRNRKAVEQESYTVH